MNIQDLNSAVWYKNYQPKNMNNIMLPKSMKAYFTKLMKSGKDLPPLLFHSVSPGTGKSTCAWCLINDLDVDYIYINGSLENGIDMIRDKIVVFCTTASFEGKKKIVFLDEFDGITMQAQKALRGLVDEFINYCGFIVTLNYVSTIIEPITSRFTMKDFNFTSEEIKTELVPKFAKYINDILDIEKVERSSEIIETVVKKFYPDVRKMVNICQEYSEQNNVIDSGILKFEEISNELIEFILKRDFLGARRFVINNNISHRVIFSHLYKHLLPRLLNTPLQKRFPEILIILAKYDRESYYANDKELQVAACLLEIIQRISI